MEKFVALLTKEKEKTAMNKWGIDDSLTFFELYKNSLYKKIRAILFP